MLEREKWEQKERNSFVTQMEDMVGVNGIVEGTEQQNQTPTFINGVALIPDSARNRLGGVIQPLNTQFTGYDVVDIDNEDPEVQWIPDPGFVAVTIGTEEVTPLSMDDIAAINVAPERTPSTDDERPASSYPLLDRRRYREDTSAILDLNTFIPLAIGSLVEIDDCLPAIEAIPLSQYQSVPSTITSTITSRLDDSCEGKVSEIRRRGKRKRKIIKKDEDPENVFTRRLPKDDDDETNPGKIPIREMSGRRHSGWRSRA
jgi:hypothetical protein